MVYCPAKNSGKSEATQFNGQSIPPFRFAPVRDRLLFVILLKYHYMRIAISLLVFLLTLQQRSPGESVDALQRWDRVGCIQSPVPNSPGTAKLCTTFFVRASTRLFIVTAGHASAETNKNSSLIFCDRAGKSQKVSLQTLLDTSSNPWFRHKTSDLAIAEIVSSNTNEGIYNQLIEIAISFDDICTLEQPRTAEIDTSGFPLTLGSSEPVSPVVVVGNIASKEVKSDNDWGGEFIVYASPALAQGTSGGPVFRRDASATKVLLVGMYIGVVSDNSGAKLSKLVPSRIIHDALARMID